MRAAPRPQRPQRYYDAERDRMVITSPSLLTVWKGDQPGVELIAGPFLLPAPVHSQEELQVAYQEWIDRGEPR